MFVELKYLQRWVKCDLFAIRESGINEAYVLIDIKNIEYMTETKLKTKNDEFELDKDCYMYNVVALEEINMMKDENDNK